jgi:membrane protein DedA with SNARE-associated domain
MSRMPRWRFLLLNAASAALWAPLVAGAGWLFGEAVSRHVQDIQRIEHGLIAAVVAVAILAHLWRRWRSRQRP